MNASEIMTRAYATALLLLMGSTAHAATLYVNCGASHGLNSIGAAVRALQAVESGGPKIISVSGACHENIVIQSLDRLTLAAANGASISDASGGKLDVIDVFDSRDVAINGFTINAGSDGVSGANGVGCGDWSSCRLSNNVIQGAGSGAGLSVFQAAQATLDGDTLQNNNAGLLVLSGSRVRQGANSVFTARGNVIGIDLRRGAFAYLGAVVENNSYVGVRVEWHSTLELTGSTISGSGGAGALVLEGSFARFTFSVITGNAGGGVVYSDLSMGNFIETTVSGNGGGTDVVCNPQFAATRGSATVGGTTNCVEP